MLAVDWKTAGSESGLAGSKKAVVSWILTLASEAVSLSTLRSVIRKKTTSSREEESRTLVDS